MTLLLPAQTPSASRGEPIKPPLRILVADDNRDLADSLALLLEIWGHDVRVAYDGQQALEIAFQYHPDVALLDIRMPRIDGCRLAEMLRLRPEFQGMKIIALSGYTEALVRRRCQEVEFDQYLLKPVAPSLLEHMFKR